MKWQVSEIRQRQLVLIGSSLLSADCFATTPRLISGVTNVNSVTNAGGSTLYTWMLVLGLVIMAASIGGWFWSSHPKSNVSDGFTKILLVGMIVGTSFTFVGGILGGAGELLSISEQTDRVHYRQLDNDETK